LFESLRNHTHFKLYVIHISNYMSFTFFQLIKVTKNPISHSILTTTFSFLLNHWLIITSIPILWALVIKLLSLSKLVFEKDMHIPYSSHMLIAYVQIIYIKTIVKKYIPNLLHHVITYIYIYINQCETRSIMFMILFMILDWLC